MSDMVAAQTGSPRWAVIRDARRLQRRRRRRALTAGLVVLAVAAALGWLDAQWAAPGRPATASPQAGVTVQRLRLTGSVLGATTLHGRVWVLTCVSRCAVDQPPFGRTMGELTELTPGSGHVLKRIRVLDPTVVAGGAGALWLAHFSSGQVTRVNPRTGATTATVGLTLPRSFVTAPPWRHFQPSGIDFAAGRVWVSTAFGYVAEIDPHGARLVGMLHSSSEATSATSAAGHTWMADELDGAASAGAHGARIATHPLAWAGHTLGVDTVARAGGLIWALGSTYPAIGRSPALAVVTTLDPLTGRVVHQWPVGSAATMLVSGAGVWVGGGTGRRLTRLTAAGSARSLRGPRVAGLLAATPRAIWAIASHDRLVRIGLPAR